MELVGKGVKLVGEDELVAADGAASRRPAADRASKAFVDGLHAEVRRNWPPYAGLSPNCGT